MSRYYHLSIYQRETIAIMLHDKDSPDTIGCDKSTVSGKIKRNLWHVRKRSRYSVAYTIEHAVQKQEVQAQKAAGDPQAHASSARRSSSSAAHPGRRVPGRGTARAGFSPKARCVRRWSQQSKRRFAASRWRRSRWSAASSSRTPRGSRRLSVLGLLLPAIPWERDTDENTNGLLRDFFSKGRSLDNVSGEEVQEVHDILNRRPRKRLGWKCLLEVFCGVTLYLL